MFFIAKIEHHFSMCKIIIDLSLCIKNKKRRVKKVHNKMKIHDKNPNRNNKAPIMQATDT